MATRHDIDTWLYEWAFYRHERRRSRRIRSAFETNCGHDIDIGEPYEYAVGKLNAERDLIQSVVCEPCQLQELNRRGHLG